MGTYTLPGRIISRIVVCAVDHLPALIVLEEDWLGHMVSAVDGAVGLTPAEAAAGRDEIV